jgi:hypothetical protein
MKAPLDAEHNFMWLLGALVFLLFSDAMFAQVDSRAGQRFVNLTLMVTMVIAVWSVDTDKRRWLTWKLGASLIFATIMISDSIIESNFLATYQLFITLIFLLFSLHLCWKQVMFSGFVDGNKVIGAICIYILIGLIWAFFYLMVEHYFPGSFKGLDPGIWQHNLEELIYYSMVTLTTLGYGDITPTLPLARFLAYAEAVTGVFYTTILVASLIGMRLAHYSEQMNHGKNGSGDT